MEKNLILDKGRDGSKEGIGKKIISYLEAIKLLWDLTFPYATG